MSFNLQGQLHVMGNEQTLKPTLRKREFVLLFAENPNYPQYLKFDLFNDKCSLLDGFNPGDKLEVAFNLRGREWVNPKGEKVYITSLEAWKISRPGATKTNAPSMPVSSQEEDPFAGADLPF